MWAGIVRACHGNAVQNVKQHFWPLRYFLSYEKIQHFECERQKIRRSMHPDTQTHTLGAAEAVTSLLGRRVTNEPEHIFLALEMSRGVKMSPQIAHGHQMSPFHSTPHPSLSYTLFLFCLFLICLSFSFWLD